MKKHVYKKGDRVRIMNPKFIKRIGYPLVFTDLMSEFGDHPNLVDAMILLGIIEEQHRKNYIGDRGFRAKRDFIEGCAKAAVRARGWGGKERQIFYYETISSDNTELLSSDNWRADHTGAVTEVLGKYTRMTGTYYPPSGGQRWDGEYDYEPGGLENQKAHVILKTSLGDIEVCDVELVEQ